eukprot:68253_1
MANLERIIQQVPHNHEQHGQQQEQTPTIPAKVTKFEFKLNGLEVKGYYWLRTHKWTLKCTNDEKVDSHWFLQSNKLTIAANQGAITPTDIAAIVGLIKGGLVKVYGTQSNGFMAHFKVISDAYHKATKAMTTLDVKLPNTWDIVELLGRDDMFEQGITKLRQQRWNKKKTEYAYDEAIKTWTFPSPADLIPMPQCAICFKRCRTEHGMLTHEALMHNITTEYDAEMRHDKYLWNKEQKMETFISAIVNSEENKSTILAQFPADIARPINLQDFELIPQEVRKITLKKFIFVEDDDDISTWVATTAYDFVASENEYTADTIPSTYTKLPYDEVRRVVRKLNKNIQDKEYIDSSDDWSGFPFYIGYITKINGFNALWIMKTAKLELILDAIVYDNNEKEIILIRSENVMTTDMRSLSLTPNNNNQNAQTKILNHDDFDKEPPLKKRKININI